jgi:hypothetical protein
MAKPWQCFHYPFPVNGFYTGTIKVWITHSQYHCTTAHINSSNHPLSHHRSNSSSSSATNFPWLTSTLQFCQPPCNAECLQDNSSARTTHRKQMSPVRYLASPLARWLLPTENTRHVTATHCCCDVIAPVRKCFHQPLPRNGLHGGVIPPSPVS